MAKKILHLRGTKEDYLHYGVTVGDGELALERRDGAPTRIKIGDGKTPYSELPYYGKTSRTVEQSPNDLATVELTHGYQINAGLHSAYELVLPEKIEEDYECSLCFYTSITSPAFTYPSKIIFLGDSCEGGLFRPEASTSYLLSFKQYDSSVYAAVLAAPLKNAYEAYSEICESSYKTPATIVLKDNKNLLDISLGGYFGGADTDGYVRGLGNFDYEEEKFSITFDAFNAHLFDFEQMRSSAHQYKKTLNVSDTEDGFKMTLGANTMSSVIVSTMLRPSKKSQYRIRCRVRILDEQDSPTPGTVKNSPFSLRYFDQSNVKPEMVAQQDGTYLIDYLTTKGKDVQYFFFASMGDPTTVEFFKDGFSFCAELEGIESPAFMQSSHNTIFLSDPLLGIQQVCDTLSLCSMTVTRRIYAGFIENLKIYSTEGDFTVFYLDLPVPMARGGEILSQDFSRIDDPEELPYSPYSYFVDEDEQILMLTADSDYYDVESMMEYISYELEGSCYAYERETPLIEKLDAAISFRHFENYMVLRYELSSNNASFILTQYKEKEE